jgi:cytochrome c oxidase cbb3-type subunit 3
MTSPKANGTPRKGLWTRPRIIGAAALGVLVIALIVVTQVMSHQAQARMLRMFPDDVANDPALVKMAVSMAKPTFARHCASCHGADMKGDRSKGAPNLSDNIWLYDFGKVADIETTVLYGVRSGLGKSRNITDMPGLGLSGQLYPYEVRDAAKYVLYLSTGKTDDQEAIKRGSAIFQDKGVCYDCHSSDAQGNSDYGSPGFTDQDWLYGGDYDTVYHSIYYGRHGRCPAWVDKLSAAQIRAMAVYLYVNSHKPTPTKSASAAHDTHLG